MARIKEAILFQITDMEFYQENNRFYGKIKARGEDEKGVWELEVPKVFTGFSVGERVFPEEVYDPDFMREPDKRVVINGQRFNVEKAFDTKVKHDILYKMNLVEPRVVDMTIEEIEEKLGHKIRIVDKKEDK